MRGWNLEAYAGDTHEADGMGKKYPGSFLPLLSSILPVFPIGWTHQEATGQEVLANGTLCETKQSMEKIESEGKLAVDQQPLFSKNMKDFAYKCKLRWEPGETVGVVHFNLRCLNMANGSYESGGITPSFPNFLQKTNLWISVCTSIFLNIFYSIFSLPYIDSQFWDFWSLGP